MAALFLFLPTIDLLDHVGRQIVTPASLHNVGRLVAGVIHPCFFDHL
jgi:hypothetical protein